MAQYIQLPDNSYLEFPDDMSTEEMEQHTQKFWEENADASAGDLAKSALINAVAGINSLTAAAADKLGDTEYADERQQMADKLYTAADSLLVNSPIMNAQNVNEAWELFKQRPLNSTGDFLTYQLSNMIPFAGTAGAGAKIATKTFGKLAAKELAEKATPRALAGLTGATLGQAPLFAGSNVQRAKDETGEYNLGESLAASLGQGLLSSVQLGRGIGKLGGNAGSNALSRGFAGAAEGAVLEPITEVGQQALERYSAGLSLTDDSAKEEYKLTAALSMLPGAVFGGAGNLINKPVKTQKDLADLKDILNEDIEASDVPVSNFVTNEKEADAALKNAGMSPTIFSTPEAKIKAANIAIDKADQMRMQFFDSTLDRNSPLRAQLKQTSVMTPFKQAILQKQEITDKVMAETSIEEMAPVFKDKSFGKWFRGSKLVDEKGNPLEVYHGGGLDFDNFKTNDEEYSNQGLYFSKDKKYAQQYADKKGGKVRPVYVDLKNPKITNKLEESGFLSKDDIKKLKEQGYDGVINDAFFEVVAFDPSQVKFADKVDASIDTNASAEAIDARNQLNSKKRNKSLVPPQGETKVNTADTTGYIFATEEDFDRGFGKEIAGLNKKGLVNLATDRYKIEDKDLKNERGQYLKNDELKAKILEKRGITTKEAQPKPIDLNKLQDPDEYGTVMPLRRVLPDNLYVAAKGAQALIPPPSVAKGIQQVVNQVKRISGETKTPFDKIDKHLKIDHESNNFETPLAAAQAGNYIFTATVFNDTVSHSNIDAHLQETWEYAFDNMSESGQKELLSGVNELAKAVEKDSEIPSHNFDLWLRNDLGKRELLSHVFARVAQDRRTKSKSPLQGVPKEYTQAFNKVINAIEKTKTATRGLAANSFEDIFQHTTEGQTPRQAINESVYALRNERLLRLSDAIQHTHWNDLDERALVDDFKQTLDAYKMASENGELQRAGLYATKLGSFTHLASIDPIAAAIHQLNKTLNTEQSRYMHQLAEAGNAWVREESPEVQVKAIEVLDHLMNTNQPIQRDAEGAIYFERDGKTVRITHPRMIQAIEAPYKMFQAVLSQAEVQIKGDLARYVSGFDPESASVKVSDIRKLFDEQVDNGDITQKDIMDVDAQLETLENINSLKGKVYMPRTRFGEYGFTVHHKDNLTENGTVKKDVDPVYHAQVEKGKHKGLYDEYQYNLVQKELKEYRNNPDYVIYEGFEMTYQNIYDKLSQDAYTMEMIAGLIGTEKGEQYYTDVMKKLDTKVQYRGFGRRFGEAKNIPGYSKDYLRVVNSYMGAASRFFANAQIKPVMDNYVKMMNDNLGDLHNDIKKAVNSYHEYVRSPHDEYINIRAANFLWTMGFNPSTAIIQIMTLPTTTISSMSQYNPNMISNAGYLAKTLKIAMAEFSKPEMGVSTYENGAWVFRLDTPKFLETLKKKYKFSQEAVDFVKKLYQEGRISGLLEEQAGLHDFETRTTTGKAKKKLLKIANYSGSMIAAMEQATRFSTAVSHYLMFEKNPEAVKRAIKVLGKDYRFQQQRKIGGRTLNEDLAFFGMDEAHAEFGKIGRSPIMRGGLGAFVFPFQTYPQQMLEFAIRMLGRGKEGKQAAVIMASMLFMFAGALGLPGAMIFKELAEEAYKFAAGEEVDLEMMLRDKLTKETGDARWGQFATQGLIRPFLNLDVSQRIALSIPGQDLLFAMLGVKGDMTELMGVQGSMLTNAFQAISAYNTDESGAKVASLVTPQAMSNLFKAYSYYDEGVKTRAGTQLVAPEQIDAGEVLARVLGFTTGTVASAREAKYWSDVLDRRYQPKMTSLKSKGKNQLTNAYRLLNKGKPEEAEKWFEKYRKTLGEANEFLTKRNEPFNIGAFNKAVLDAVDQRLSSSVRLKDVNKTNRQHVDDISKAAGVLTK